MNHQPRTLNPNDVREPGPGNPEPGTVVGRVLIAGISTRAAAESAARAGFDVVALDAFADLDQHPSVRALSLPRDFGEQFTPQAVVKAACRLPTDAFVYLSSFENYPDSVAALSATRSLWGNSPAVLHDVRDPLIVADAFTRFGCRAPRVLLAEASPTRTGFAPDERWLLKPLASGGGHGVRLWRVNEPIPAHHYVQEFIDGAPGSVVFVAARGTAAVLGVSRQLIGERKFGAAGYRYCGSILTTRVSEAFADSAECLARTAVSAWDLTGVGSIDFISSGEALWPIEVNPRWTSSLELVERACGLSIFAVHVDACTRGALPAFEFKSGAAAAAIHGKAIVFARRDVTVGDTRAWLDDLDIRDIPHPGERIAAGQPICTVFARTDDEANCYKLLVERAERVYEGIG